MSDATKIEWTDATWNPITGCSVVSPGCRSCYAMKLAGTRMRNHPSRAGLTVPTATGPVWNGLVRLNEGWLQLPLQWARPRRIFVCAHGDLFHEDVPDDWIDRVFAVMALAQRHSFQVLTKRAQRMHAYLTAPVREMAIGRQVSELQRAVDGSPVSEWPGMPLPNVWGGISVEDQLRADERLPWLSATPLAVRWVSAEPLLGAVDLMLGDPFAAPHPDWIVVGGESGPRARPMHPEWAAGLRNQADAKGTAFLFKQWGEWVPRSGTGQNWRELFGADMVLLKLDGTSHHHDDGMPFDAGDIEMYRVGKARAGRLLDGRLHDAYPQVPR